MNLKTMFLFSIGLYFLSISRFSLAKTFVEVVDAPSESDEGSENTIESWMTDAVRDVAFYLRRHKFHGYDLRYKNNTLKNLHDNFPEPPLRKIHWQVRRNCETSFSKCLKYLAFIVNEAVFTRQSTVMTSGTNFMRRRNECLQLLDEENNWTKEFRNRLDKFHWMISASYFMCWYTNMQQLALQNFGESCDNFASCLSNDETYDNNDIRANDEHPFACALYSFCPDPCCSNRILKSLDECADAPCGIGKACAMNRSENVHFQGIVNNDWNISCECEESGTIWDSKSGLCVDIDECIEELPLCDSKTESCLNLPNGYACVCAFGYLADEHKLPCHLDPLLKNI